MPLPPPTTAVYFQIGGGAPTGIIGLEGVHRFGPTLEVGGGVGIGASASNSERNPSIGHVLQWAVMPRWRIGRDRDALTLGAGLSGGNFGKASVFEGCDSNEPCYSVEYVLWANVEAGGEHSWRSGFSLRYFGGYARSINADKGGIPYFGFGLGYSF